MKCPLLTAAIFSSPVEATFDRVADDCREEKCAWWVPLVKPGPRGEKGACAINYMGVFAIERGSCP